MAKLSNDDSRFAAVVVDGAGVEFHLVNTAGSNYRYAVKRASDGAIVYTIPGDKHAGGGLALRSDGTIIVSIAALDPSTGKYPIYNYAVPGVATPPSGGGGGGGGGGSTTNVDQVARDMATAAQNTANAAQSTANSAKSTADSAKNTANSAKDAAAAAQNTANQALGIAQAALTIQSLKDFLWGDDWMRDMLFHWFIQERAVDIDPLIDERLRELALLKPPAIGGPTGDPDDPQER